MSLNYEEIVQILDNGSNKEKIKILESLSTSNDFKIIQKIISMLDDQEIEIRGEVFSSLVQNENKISKILIKNLSSQSKNIKGFGALILANRNDEESISSIIELTNDESSMVRACALGALGFLKAHKAKGVIQKCFDDTNLEVKKCALKAAIDIGQNISDEKIKAFNDDDVELKKLVIKAQNRN